MELRTERLLLRHWRDEDRAPFAALNADPEVMRHFPAPLTRAESDAMAERVGRQLDERGWGLWVVDAGAGCLGFVGLAVPRFGAHFTPAVEIGWRLARSAWGKGYATEAAYAVLDHAFGPVGLDEVVSFTTVGNTRSRAVMERIGMHRDPAEDFDHPLVPEGSPIRRHVLYRLAADEHDGRGRDPRPSTSGRGTGLHRGSRVLRNIPIRRTAGTDWWWCAPAGGVLLEGEVLA